MKHASSSPDFFGARTLVAGALLASLALAGLPRRLDAQTLGFNRDTGRVMLGVIKGELKKSYYDVNFHGLDLDKRFKLAEEKLSKAATPGQVWGVIAQAVLDLNDSHTFFIPPPLPDRFDYGWMMRMTGDKCLIAAVKPGSDAEAKGLRPGDEVWSIDGFAPTRENLWKIKYYYYALRPRENVTLVVRKPDGKEQELNLVAKVTKGHRTLETRDFWDLIREAENESRLVRQRYYEAGDELLIWKMPDFEMSGQELATAMDKVRKRKALILDLRGNGGGLAENLERLVGLFFDQDVKIADLKGRKEMKPRVGRAREGGGYKGRVVVIVDSESASAAELFARVIQLEKRGVVVGDRTAGAVMLSQIFSYEVGAGIVTPYGLSVTAADLIMSDGKSLEGKGVTPDETVLPTPDDVASGRDPVLSRAAALLGVDIDPRKAGTLFPVEWRR